MPKFAKTEDARVKPRLRTAFSTVGLMPTHERGVGASRDPKSELFILAISYLAERSFYETTAEAREQRLSLLVHAVTTDDPEWVAALVPWLRNVANLRSVAIVIAGEYVAAGGPHGRAVVASACQRADEPAEMLGYWTSRFGRSLPMPVKRGLADAAVRLYTERSLLKYDGNDKAIRFADVIELAHPKASAPWQDALFRHALDRRHGRGDQPPSPELPAMSMLALDREMRAIPEADRRAVITGHPDVVADRLARAGWSWERLAGWLPGGMDRAAWEAIIPTMGYMALLRNLRNFDEVGVSDEVAETVCRKLADPEEVASSRQLPIRFYSAFKEAQSLRWAHALEKALDLSLGNVPSLDGQTLILLDLSPSMSYDNISEKSKRTRAEIAAVFAIALAKRCETANIIAYSTKNEWMQRWPAMPLLRAVEDAERWCAANGNGTATFATLAQHWNPRYKRVVIVTDEQARDAGHYDLSPIPLIYTFNLGGYRPAQMEEGPGRFTVGGGLSDSTFQLLALLDSRKPGVWPHMVLRGQERYVG